MHPRINRQFTKSIDMYVAHMEVNTKKKKNSAYGRLWIHSCGYGLYVCVLEPLNAKKWTNVQTKRTNVCTIKEVKKRRKKMCLQLLIHSHFHLATGDCPVNVLVSWKHAHCTYSTSMYYIIREIFHFNQFHLMHKTAFFSLSVHGYSTHGNVKQQHQNIHKLKNKVWTEWKKNNDNAETQRWNRNEKPIGCILPDPLFACS